MQMLTISVSTLLIPVILVITIAVFFIYKAFYDKHTNQVLESGETKKRKWIAPWGLALIVLGAQLVLVAGLMFPIYMFTVDSSTVASSQLSSDMPLTFDVNDKERFVIDDSYYEEVTTLSEDGITVTIYKSPSESEMYYYVFLGEIEKERNWPMSLCIKFENAGHDASLICELTAVCDGDKAYFKCEALAEPDVPASLFIGIKNGPIGGMSSDFTDFDKDVKLVF